MKSLKLFWHIDLSMHRETIDWSVFWVMVKLWRVYQKTPEMTDGIWTLTTQVVESELLPAIPEVLKLRDLSKGKLSFIQREL